MVEAPTKIEWHPAYRAHVEWALWDLGLLYPEVGADGEMSFLADEKTDDGWHDYRATLICEDYAGLIVCACAMADAASGLPVGREVAERFTNKYRVERGKAMFEEVCERHKNDLQYMSDSAQHVARRLSAQASGKKFEWEPWG